MLSPVRCEVCFDFFHFLLASPSFSRHAKAQTSLSLVIWLTENLDFMCKCFTLLQLIEIQ